MSKILIVAATLSFIGGKAHSRFRAYFELKREKEVEGDDGTKKIVVVDPADELSFRPAMTIEHDSEEILEGRPMRSVTFTIDAIYAKDFADAYGFVLDEDHLAAIKAARERHLELHPELVAPLASGADVTSSSSTVTATK